MASATRSSSGVGRKHSARKTVEKVCKKECLVFNFREQVPLSLLSTAQHTNVAC